ncbi:hypothetical protein VP01_2635g2 [Puccinia sorghi]|uniref:CCHC-type domain-containing protein n=1 Tax=Puccinia sorghi TaxID=27349 RepID=A0A0L6V499_9BASI|nr:hypothetical protein VP01_2635g2 [Puccinia sorghi]
MEHPVYQNPPLLPDIPQIRSLVPRFYPHNRFVTVFVVVNGSFPVSCFRWIHSFQKLEGVSLGVMTLPVSEKGLPLSWDKILSLIIQTNLRGDLRQLLDQKFDLFMEAHDHWIPSSQDILRFLDAAQTEQQMNDLPEMTETNSFRTTLASRDFSSVSGIQSSVSGSSLEEPFNNRHVYVNAITRQGNCYICKKPGHIAPACPHKKHGGPTNLNTISHPPHPIMHNRLVPSITTMIRQLMSILCNHPTTFSNSHTSKPRNNKQSTTNTSSPEVESKEVDCNLFAKEPIEDYTFENEDLLVLTTFDCFDLRKLVVDRNDQDTLKFSGKSSTTIAAKKICYCKAAQSTLLFIAAVKKSDARFQFTGNFDAIDLLMRSGKLLLYSTFDPKTNTWPLPTPFRSLQLPHEPPFPLAPLFLK